MARHARRRLAVAGPGLWRGQGFAPPILADILMVQLFCYCAAPAHWPRRAVRIRASRGEDWGWAEKLRAGGQEPEWWHWVYGGTCFRLSERVKTQSGRALILSRGTVMTRGGTEALKQQLWAEAMRQGLAQAKEVLVIGDKAVWIWNIAGDRFQRSAAAFGPVARAGASGVGRIGSQHDTMLLARILLAFSAMLD
jgi:hypothetical protein